MSHQVITQEELRLTIEYLHYTGPITSNFPLEPETEKNQSLSEVVASSAF